ncbi:MAG TPA: helix-turn-helix transcriptional regulator [Usitatibacter sp.]|nr:helix-turn-helix transcriptional regulator [Usitatibacter sp.]
MNDMAMMDPRSERMLELLSEGASARVIAKKLGYSEGTMRVYLHNLYRAIGVRNKTEAVIWHMNRVRPATPQPAAAAAPSPSTPAIAAGYGFGEMALAEDLYTALGVMGTFVGPYGQLWEAGLRLKGTPIDENSLAQRAQSRLLWRALLKGEFAYAKMLYDEGVADRIAAQSPTDGVSVVCLLTLGGYSAAAARLVAALGDKRKGVLAVGGREMALMRAVGEAVDGRSDASIASLYEIAAEKGRTPVLKQLAVASLYQVYRMRKHAEAARQAADALWAEAEAARQQLEAMGIRPLPREASLPAPGLREAAAAVRKAALAR